MAVRQIITFTHHWRISNIACCAAAAATTAAVFIIAIYSIQPYMMCFKSVMQNFRNNLAKSQQLLQILLVLQRQ